MISFNNPVEASVEDPTQEVINPVTASTEATVEGSVEAPIVEAPTDVTLPDNDGYGFSEYLPEAAQFLYDKGHIKHLPEGFNPEELDVDSYNSLIAHNLEVERKESFTKGLESYQEQLQAKLPSMAKKILQYSLENQNVSDQDIQAIIEESRTQDYFSNLDPESNPERVVREYYKHIGWDADSIDDKVSRLIEFDGLTREATSVKPHLDKVADQISAQREQDDKAIRDFQNNLDKSLEVQTTKQLKSGKLNGVQLDQETAEFLRSAVMNKNVPVQLGKQTVEMGYAEALMRDQKYRGNVENVMLSLLILRDGPKALDKYFSQPMKNKAVVEHVKEIKFGSRKRGSAKKPVNKDFKTGITFNIKKT